MKLNQQQTQQIQNETGLEPIPSEVAEESGLTEHFGDETFYLNADGIFVFEEGRQATAEGSEDASKVTAVKIAAVEQSGEGDGVTVHGVEPQETTMTVELT